jgi:hypothetical protein
MDDIKPYGFYGCKCHPFENWKECDREHKKKIPVGTPVRHRCLGTEGILYSISEVRGFVMVKYGERPCDHHQEHVANLIIIKEATDV